MAKSGVTVKYNGKTKSKRFTQEIMVDQVKRHENNIRGSLKTHGIEVKTELKKVISTSVGNGRHYAGLPNRSSSEGNAPVSQSGNLLNLFYYKASPLQLILGNKAEYSNFLDEGTKKMGARPYFLVTIEAQSYKLEKELQDLPK